MSLTERHGERDTRRTPFADGEGQRPAAGDHAQPQRAPRHRRRLFAMVSTFEPIVLYLRLAVLAHRLLISGTAARHDGRCSGGGTLLGTGCSQ